MKKRNLFKKASVVLLTISLLLTGSMPAYGKASPDEAARESAEESFVAGPELLRNSTMTAEEILAKATYEYKDETIGTEDWVLPDPNGRWGKSFSSDPAKFTDTETGKTRYVCVTKVSIISGTEVAAILGTTDTSIDVTPKGDSITVYGKTIGEAVLSIDFDIYE